MHKDDQMVIAPHSNDPRDVRECARDNLETFCKSAQQTEGILIVADHKKKQITCVGFGRSMNPRELLAAVLQRLERGDDIVITKQ